MERKAIFKFQGQPVLKTMAFKLGQIFFCLGLLMFTVLANICSD